MGRTRELLALTDGRGYRRAWQGRKPLAAGEVGGSGPSCILDFTLRMI